MTDTVGTPMQGRIVAGLVGVVLGVLVALGLVYAFHRRTPSAVSAPDAVPFDGSSCAFAEPLRVHFLFNCDALKDTEPGLCKLTEKLRAVTRDNYRVQVLGLRDQWSSTMRLLRVVERFESGELAFSPEVAQRVFDAVFRTMNVEDIPAAPKSLRGFLMALECSPHTWASAMLSALPALTDIDLDETSSRMPPLVGANTRLERALSFLSSAGGGQ